MKEGIHPSYQESHVTCACGNEFVTRSTRPTIKLVICSQCHPFYTGNQRFVDSAGRVEKFQKKFQKTGGRTVKRAPAKAQKARSPMKSNILSTAPVRVKKTATKGTSTDTPKKAKSANTDQHK